MGKHYHHLTCEERSLIQVSLELGQSQAEIARSLSRERSCISRELKRNGWINPAMQVTRRGRPAIAGGYRSSLAQQRADLQVSKTRNPKRLIVGNKLWDIMMRLPCREGKLLDAKFLAVGRKYCSERGMDYVHIIQGMIRSNKGL